MKIVASPRRIRDREYVKSNAKQACLVCGRANVAKLPGVYAVAALFQATFEGSIIVRVAGLGEIMSACFKVYGPFEILNKQKIYDPARQEAFWTACVEAEDNNYELSLAKWIYLSVTLADEPGTLRHADGRRHYSILKKP
jgi:hypothetical protein